MSAVRKGSSPRSAFSAFVARPAVRIAIVVVGLAIALCAALATQSTAPPTAAADSYGWTWATATYPGNDVWDVACLPGDSQHVTAVGKYGDIYASSDGGSTWASRKITGVADYFYGIDFASATNGWAVGTNGRVVTTTNGGSTWNPVTPSPAAGTLRDVSFFAEGYGWMVGDTGLILSCSPAGYTDVSNAALTTKNLRAVSTYSSGGGDNHCIIVGAQGTILWGASGTLSAATNPAGTGTTCDFNGATMADAGNGWAVGVDNSTANQYGIIIHTTDGGQTWTKQGPGYLPKFYAVTCTDANHAWAVGNTGAIRVTSDGGATWVGQSQPLGEQCWGVAFSDSLHGWVACGNGVCLSTTTGGYISAPPSPSPSTDTTPPTTTLSGADSAWHKAPVALTLSAADNTGGSGMSGGSAKTEYQVDGGAWATGTSFTVSSSAIHQVSYRSTDAAGNTETAKTAAVKIDTVAPTVSAKAASGKHGHAITLKFRISDNLSPQAQGVAVTIKNSKRKTVKSLVPGTRATGGWLTATWKPKTKGSYTFTVAAKDLAGNAAKAATAKITVK
jgi:photosystem II stability/assembly factor-like uncharacterized protein